MSSTVPPDTYYHVILSAAKDLAGAGRFFAALRMTPDTYYHVILSAAKDLAGAGRFFAALRMTPDTYYHVILSAAKDLAGAGRFFAALRMTPDTYYHVILSAAKDLAGAGRFFAALRMTARNERCRLFATGHTSYLRRAILRIGQPNVVVHQFRFWRRKTDPLVSGPNANGRRPGVCRFRPEG